MFAKNNMTKRKTLIFACFGIAIGLCIGTVLKNYRALEIVKRCSMKPTNQKTPFEIIGLQPEDTIQNSQKNLVFVGVMTAKNFIEGRARAVYDTWGKEVPGRIAFFSSEGSYSDELPVIGLKNVDDRYPPQKKSFMMLYYMYENYIDKFEWFIRADDDVYIEPQKLEKFLRSIDSSKPQFIGQAGKGNSEEFGLLSLEFDENFCMGGPGVILSSETLRRVAPHIPTCLKNLYSTHEDVEIGRCVQKFAGIPCTWNYEMQYILRHNSSGRAAFTGKLKRKEIHNAISLHPIKQAPLMYRLHSYVQGLKAEEMRQESLLLHRDIKRMAKYLEIPDDSRYLVPGIALIPEEENTKRHFEDHNILGAGKSTGIVTTTTITHASPSGNYAHVASRHFESDKDVVKSGVLYPEECQDIASQLIESEPGKNFDVLMGGGFTKFLPSNQSDIFGKKGERLDGKDLIHLWKLENPQGAFVSTLEELQNLDYTQTKKIFGLFHSSHLDYNAGKKLINPKQPRLKDMTASAIKMLQKNPEGYFVFIEGGRIDHGHHETRAGYALDETLEFDEAIKTAVDMTSDEDTLIVVTSDHSHSMNVVGYPGRGNPILGLNEYDVDLDGVPFSVINYAVGPKQYIEVKNNTWKRKDLTKDHHDCISPDLNKFAPKSRDDLLEWSFLARSLYSTDHSNPKHKIDSAMREGLEDVITEVMENINNYSRQRGRVIEFRELLYGYTRLNALHGQDLILDLLLIYKKYRGKKMTVPVRRHLYVQRAFTGIFIKEFEEDFYNTTLQKSFFKNILNQGVETLSNHFSLPGLLAAGNQNGLSNSKIVFVLPIAGRLTTFKRFLDVYEKVAIEEDGYCDLLVVIFGASSEIQSHLEELRNLKSRHIYQQINYIHRQEDFSRGVALDTAARSSYIQDDNIILFIDVDMVFKLETLQRIRLNTLQGKQVYLPIVFSQYDPKRRGQQQIPADEITNESGYFRQYGFGICAIYKSDIMDENINGFDKDITGWGLEDVKFLDKIVKSGNRQNSFMVNTAEITEDYNANAAQMRRLTIFRAPDPSLVHIYHDINCDINLETAQYNMCLGTKANSLGSTSLMEHIFYNNPDNIEFIKDFNQKKEIR